MGFSLRIGSMLVTADTAAEAADLVRALGEVMPEPVKRPQGTGGVIETPAGYQIRLRTGPGKRVHRGGFKTRDEAEAALTTLVDTGVAPPLKRHRRPKPPANDTAPAPLALPTPAPTTYEAAGEAAHRAFEEASERLSDDEGTDLTDLVDVPDAEPTAMPDLNLGVECHACGQRGHIMSSPECPLTTKPGWSPGAVRALAEPRTRMPPSFTETPLTMRRHLHVIDPGAEPVDEQRPRTRGECQGEARPCPWSGCRYHLALDVLETGNLHRTFGEMDLAEMPDTCALDVADRDGATLEEIGRALNVSRERIRQIETLAIKSAKKNAKRLGLRFEAPDEPRSNAPEDAL